MYVWSSGTVSARFEGAHKSEVLGLLFVDGVGLFTCGKGGMLKVCVICIRVRLGQHESRHRHTRHAQRQHYEYKTKLAQHDKSLQGGQP